MSEQHRVRAKIVVRGVVQGVGYRAFVQREAACKGLYGEVWNRDDGCVEADVEGERGLIEALTVLLQTGPPSARVGEVQVQWGAPTGKHDAFCIRY